MAAAQRLMAYARLYARALPIAVAKFVAVDGWALASHVALSGLTALFPFLIFLGALAGLFGQYGLAERASGMLFEIWPPEVAGPIAREVHNVLTVPRTGLALFGAVAGLYFAASAVEAMRLGLNRAYQLEDERPLWRLYLNSLTFVLIGGAMLLAFTFLVVLAPLIWAQVLRRAPALAPLTEIVTLLRLGATLALMFVTISLLHRNLPAVRHSFAARLPGVGLTCVLWIAAGEIFGAYLERFSGSYISTYAGLGSIMAAIVFLYILSALFLFGGAFNAAIAEAKPAPDPSSK